MPARRQGATYEPPGVLRCHATERMPHAVGVAMVADGAEIDVGTLQALPPDPVDGRGLASVAHDTVLHSCVGGQIGSWTLDSFGHKYFENGCILLYYLFLILCTCWGRIQYPDVVVSGTPVVGGRAVVPQYQDLSFALETPDSAYVSVSSVLLAPFPVRTTHHPVANTLHSCISWIRCPCH